MKNEVQGSNKFVQKVCQCFWKYQGICQDSHIYACHVLWAVQQITQNEQEQSAMSNLAKVCTISQSWLITSHKLNNC